MYSSERRRELRGAVAVTPRARVIRLPRRSTPHLRSRCPRRSRCAWSPPGCTSSSSRRPCRPRYRDSSKSATSRRCTRTRSASRGWAAAGTCAAGCATPPPPRASIASVRLARRGRRDRGAIARAAPRAAAIAPAASKSSNEPRRGPVVIASQLCPTRRASSTRKPFFFLAPAPTSLPP